MQCRDQIHVFLNQNFSLNALRSPAKTCPRARLHSLPLKRIYEGGICPTNFLRAQTCCDRPAQSRDDRRILKVSHTLHIVLRSTVTPPTMARTYQAVADLRSFRQGTAAIFPMAAQRLLPQGSPYFHSGSEVTIWKPSMSCHIDLRRG
jgi:hypothetical protein